MTSVSGAHVAGDLTSCSISISCLMKFFYFVKCLVTNAFKCEFIRVWIIGKPVFNPRLV